MTILILSAACCYPGMAAFDEQAKKVIERAAEEAGVKAEIKIIPGSAAIYGGAVPKMTVQVLMSKFSRNETGPAILIDGEIVSFGVPNLEDMKAIFEKQDTKENHQAQGEQNNE
jgi:hypothetical protein